MASQLALSTAGDIQHDAPPASCKVVLAQTVAKSLLSEVQDNLKKIGRSPLLVGFLANADPAARMYADWTARTCKENGFAYQLREVDKEDLEEAILGANHDDSVDGIIVYFPVFGGGQDQYLQQITTMSKDVEGLSHKYLFNMYQNIRYLDPQTKAQKCLLPCTPLAVIKILEYIGVYNTILPYGNRLFGKTITIVNRSEIVGRPLAALLANDGANVYSVDITGVQHYTRGVGIKMKQHQVHDTDFKLEDVALKSDVIVTGVPTKSYKFPLEFVKDGAVCINFSSEKNFEPAIKERASIYVPAIGKVTIVILLRNLLRLIENREGAKRAIQN
ncbi:hypothetical protein EV426DRAFT_580917 [Tirmania nivea]|nr:hypothetical protein EV426DRAFT_580917 [Tirmania nivea]